MQSCPTRSGSPALCGWWAARCPWRSQHCEQTCDAQQNRRNWCGMAPSSRCWWCVLTQRSPSRDPPPAGSRTTSSELDERRREAEERADWAGRGPIYITNRPRLLFAMSVTKWRRQMPPTDPLRCTVYYEISISGFHIWKSVWESKST